MKMFLSFALLFVSGLSFGQSSKYERVSDSLNVIGQREKIIPYLELELKAKPKDEILLRMLGAYHIQAQHLDLGEQYYREALLVNPKCANCYLHIGRTYAMRNEYNKAMEYFNLAVLTDPKDGFIVLWRARLKEHQGDKPAALADYNLAVQLNPKHGDAYLQRAVFHAGSGELALALTDFNQTIALQPNDLVPYLHRGSIHYKLEQLDAACQDYQTAKKLNSAAKVKDTLLTSQIEAALQDICDPAKPSFYYQRGIANYNLKQYPSALASYEQGLKKFPGNTMILNFQGNTYLALKQYDKALNCYQLTLKNMEKLKQEIRSNPRFSTAGKPDPLKAEKETASAFLAEIHYHIAECKMAKSAYTEALTAINEAISFLPDAADFPKESYFQLREQVKEKLDTKNIRSH